MYKTTLMLLYVSLLIILLGIAKENNELKKQIKRQKIQIEKDKQKIKKIEDIEKTIQILTTKNKQKDKLTNEQVFRLSSSIYFISQLYGLQPEFLIGLSYAESNLRKHAKSKMGCVGYFQINQRVHKVDKKQLYDQLYQVMFSAKLYNDLYNRFQSHKLALNAYNGRLYNNSYYKYVNNKIQIVMDIRNDYKLGT